jgi:hypothetical protein
MESLSQEKFKALYEALPPDLKEVLNSSDINDGIAKICDEYGFADKFSEMQGNVALVIMGALSLEDFKNYLGIVTQQGSVAVYNKIYALVFGGIERYLIFENGQTFFGSEEAPIPKNNPAQPLKTSSAPPRPEINNTSGDPYREKPE